MDNTISILSNSIVIDNNLSYIYLLVRNTVTHCFYSVSLKHDKNKCHLKKDNVLYINELEKSYYVRAYQLINSFKKNMDKDENIDKYITKNTNRLLKRKNRKSKNNPIFHKFDTSNVILLNDIGNAIETYFSKRVSILPKCDKYNKEIVEFVNNTKTNKLLMNKKIFQCEGLPENDCSRMNVCSSVINKHRKCEWNMNNARSGHCHTISEKQLDSNMYKHSELINLISEINKQRKDNNKHELHFQYAETLFLCHLEMKKAFKQNNYKLIQRILKVYDHIKGILFEVNPHEIIPLNIFDVYNNRMGDLNNKYEVGDLTKKYIENETIMDKCMKRDTLDNYTEEEKQKYNLYESRTPQNNNIQPEKKENETVKELNNVNFDMYNQSGDEYKCPYTESDDVPRNNIIEQDNINKEIDDFESDESESESESESDFII